MIQNIKSREHRTAHHGLAWSRVSAKILCIKSAELTVWMVDGPKIVLKDGSQEQVWCQRAYLMSNQWVKLDWERPIKRANGVTKFLVPRPVD